MSEINVLQRVLKADGALTRRRNKIRRGGQRMIHSEILIKSGGHTLQKLTKTQARAEIKNNNQFHGFICGNRVKSSDIADGQNHGIEINIDNITEFNNTVAVFQRRLFEQSVTTDLNCGDYAHYYKIVDAELRNKQLRTHYAQKRPFSNHP